MFAALLGLVLTLSLSSAQMTRWGWRIPLLAGCSLLPVLLFLRRSLEETAAFQARTHRPRPAELVRLLFANWPVVLLGMMMSTMTTVCFYMVTAYTPTYGSRVLKLADTGNLIVTLCVGASTSSCCPSPAPSPTVSAAAPSSSRVPCFV